MQEGHAHQNVVRLDGWKVNHLGENSMFGDRSIKLTVTEANALLKRLTRKITKRFDNSYNLAGHKMKKEEVLNPELNPALYPEDGLNNIINNDNEFVVFQIHESIPKPKQRRSPLARARQPPDSVGSLV